MKKTISINLNGLIFYIEEDGYETLRNYLTAIHKYFSTFEDSAEIVADIESRIAEIFTTKLSPSKQVITEEDVATVVAAMGSISDFKEVEEPAEPAFRANSSYTESTYESAKAGSGTTNQDYTTYESVNPDYTEQPSGATETAPKKLYRDIKRKMIAGVASGMANYLSIDPLWIRVAWVISLFLFSFNMRFMGGNWNFSGISGFVILAYIICWIAIPGKEDLSEDKKIKKLYRNPDEKVIGGVAGGLASYFGVDVVIIRIAWVITMFVSFGFGFIPYIVLWIITPEAKSLTDRMKMEGEPVTLANIEAKVRDAFKSKTGQEGGSGSNPFTNFLDKAIIIIKTLAAFALDTIRIITGILLFILGIAFTIASVIVFGAMIGILSSDLVSLGDIPLELIRNEFPWFAAVLSFIILLIPGVLLFIGGLSLIAKKSFISPVIGWTLFALWLLASVGLAISSATLIQRFKYKSEIEQEIRYSFNNRSIHLAARDAGDDFMDQIELQLHGYQGDSVRLVKTFRAHGESRQAASGYASMTSHNVSRKDSILVFDNGIALSEGAKFRGQSLFMNLYIPYGQKFTMDNKAGELLVHTLSPAGYSRSDIKGNVWQYTKDGLQCLTCGNTTKNNRNAQSNFAGNGAYSKSFDFSGFNSVDLGGAFDIEIVKGEQYKVVISGPQEIVDKVKLEKNGNELEGNLNEYRWNSDSDSRFKRVKVHITTPELREANIHGASKANIMGFSNDNFSITVSGASIGRAELKAESIIAEVNGASQLELIGTAERLEAEINGASSLNASEFVAKEVEVEANGVSNAKVHATRKLQAESNGGSHIKYKGNPSDVSNESGFAGDISRDE